jgi:hypothetical protein
MVSKRADTSKACQSVAIANDDEMPALEVLRRSCPTAGVEDGCEISITHRLSAEVPNDMEPANRFL